MPSQPPVREVCVPVATLWAGRDAPRAVDELAVRDRPDVPGWTASMGATERQVLKGRTLTQLLLGEPALVLEDKGDWVRVAAPEQPSSADRAGYPGWIRSAHLSTPVPRTGDGNAVVMSRTARCVVADGEVLELSFGTALQVESVRSGAGTVLLPGDRRGTISLGDLRLSHERRHRVYGGEDLLDAASRLLGLPYVWGGTSAWGLDCSGLVHLVFRALGVQVPRDAADQAAAATQVPLDLVRPGDLYFFAHPDQPVHHVGFVSREPGSDGARWILHAPDTDELLSERPIAEEHLETLVSAGRVHIPDAGRGDRREES